MPMRVMEYISMSRVGDSDYNLDGDNINVGVDDDDADYLISLLITQVLYQC